MGHRILVINPGSTSTKLAYYENGKQMYGVSVNHSNEELSKFADVLEQEAFRAEVVDATLVMWGVDKRELSAVIGRGGLLPHMKAGGYLVEEEMVKALRKGIASPHASNLGGLLAWSVAEPLGIPAYIYDCVTSDEFEEVAKITGLPGIKRESMCHVLNMKAVARDVADKFGSEYGKMNFITAHLGGGISISAHKEGKIIDALRDDEGPLSPERAGAVPLLHMIDLCYSGQYTKNEMIRKIRGQGGIKAHLGTADSKLIEEMIRDGNEEAKLIYEALAYQVAKGIGQMAAVLKGKVHCIILTGGMANSEMLTSLIEERISFIAPVHIVAGEREMEALAAGAERMLSGEDARRYSEVEI